MKLKMTVEYHFEVDDDKLERIYGTTDPATVASVEATNPPEDIVAVLGLKPVAHRVEPTR